MTKTISILPRSRAAGRRARPPRSIQLGGSRQQGAPVRKRPTQVLRVGQLQAIRRQRFGQRDDLLNVIEVVAMQHGVDRQGEPELLDPARHFQLPVEDA